MINQYNKSYMHHLIDITDLTVQELDEVITLALDIIDDQPKYSRVCEGKRLATLFYEPSTRTRLSFESAMLALGGSVLGFSDAGTSSATKGESLSDTIRVICSFADMIAMRHHNDGAALAASRVTDVPIINGGDGVHCHPTQTLADLLTIKREMGRLDNLVMGMCGDLKFGRTVHSLTRALMRREGIEFVFIAPKQLDMPSYMIHEVEASGMKYREVEDMESVMPELDILYMTRVQKERFYNPAEYERLKDVYILTPEKMEAAKKKMAILHPLPRVNEISIEIDEDPRAAYFRQVANGRFIRMALICKFFEWVDSDKKNPQMENAIINHLGLRCPNPRCISHMENVPQILWPVNVGKGKYRCTYCETTVRENP